MKFYINGHDHMTKIATIAKKKKKKKKKKRLKVFLFRTRRSMILKISTKRQGMELYKVCINHDPGMTLTYFTAMST